MELIERMKRKAVEAPKNITVKIESIESGEIVKSFDCGTDKRKAEKLENGLLNKTDLDRFFVYQSITV